MSLPAKIVDFLAAATIVVIEFGVNAYEESVVEGAALFPCSVQEEYGGSAEGCG